MKINNDLKVRLKIAKDKLQQKTLNNQGNTTSNSFGKALGISTELVAAVLVGTIMGFILDNWFDSKPWLTLLFFFIGVIAGILNVFRSAKKMQNKKDKT
tara:strand:+ start:592 stop:888 length:297 start_codon:yes stop_codon:yes gene_type:complete